MTEDDVKRVRAKLGLTQDELADIVGVARNTVARWEMGMHPVSVPVERLLRTLSAPKTTVKRPKTR